MRTLIAILAVALAVPALLGAQGAPAQAKPAAAPPAPAPAGAQSKPAPQAKPAPVEAQTPASAGAQSADSYNYEPSGRRDPFLTLITSGVKPVASVRGEGIAGLSVNEMSVRGVMQSRGGFIAIVVGPDNKTYAIHQGDKLLDGVVRAVNAEGLVVVQEVNDPLSLVKQREVSKKLRSLEAKE